MSAARSAGSLARGATFAAALAVLLLELPLRVAHAWALNGVPVTLANGSQLGPITVTDGQGGAFVVWTDTRNGTEDVYAQHVLYSGAVAPGWDPNGNAIATGVGQQASPAATSDASNGLFIVWTDTRAGNGQQSIYAQHVIANGAIAFGWMANGTPICTAPGVHDAPDVVSDGADGALIAWQDGRNASTDVYAQRMSAIGVALWPANGVAISSDADEQQAPRLVADGHGGAFVGFVNFTIAGHHIAVQRFASDGTISPGWPASTTKGVAACSNAAEEDQFQITSDAQGGVFVVWRDARNTMFEGLDVFVQHVTATGALATGFTTDGYVVAYGLRDQSRPQAVADGVGGAYVVWEDPQFGDPEIWAQRVTTDAHVAPGWPAGVIGGLSISSGNSAQNAPQLCPDGRGGAYVTWQLGFANQDVYATRIVPGGGVAANWPSAGVLVSGAAGAQTAPAIVSDGHGSAILAWQDTRAAASGDLYAQRLHEVFGDLSAQVTPVGWTAPVVPRTDATATPASAIASPGLPGNSTNTWLSWSIQNLGPGSMPGWYTRAVVDEGARDFLYFAYSTAPDGNAPGAYAFMNSGPAVAAIRGGRHSVSSVVDPDDVVPESNENDNRMVTQWVWYPLFLDKATPQVRALPPDYAGTFLPNDDGFYFTRNGSAAWVVALAPTTPTDDYDLHIYDDYTNSTTGFSHEVGSSQFSSNTTDFVVGHYVGTPTLMYPAAVRWVANGGGNPYSIDGTDALGRYTASGIASWAGQPLAANRLADVYEAYFLAGTTHDIVLVRNSGTSDLAFEVFSGISGGIYGRGGGTASLAAGPDLDTLQFTASVSGYHPIVVYRPVGSGANTAATYSLSIGTGELLDAPAPAAARDLALAPASPDPVVERTRFAFSLPTAASVRLELLDVSGRRVRTLASGPFEAGEHALIWDARDDGGQRMGAGVYWARLECAGRALTRRVVVLR